MRVRSTGLCLVALAALVVACSRASSPPLENGAPNGGGGGSGGDAGSARADSGATSSVVQKDIPAVDDAVTKFMSTYGVPGVAIAVTKNEKLVYAKAYGQIGPSDTHPVTNDSLFRIASVSKPFTSAAIMRLIEQGKLTMQSTVFGASGILSEYSSANLAGVSDITIDHLLHHTSGNWPNDGNDPMFQQTSLDQHALIQWALDNYPDRGMRGQYFYSNFGFCVLGRVIEKISGKTYEQFIHDEIFSNVGITDMTIAGNTLADRKPNEVIYATTAGDGDPYGMNVTRMDSHGGWLASATDLMRFAVRVDGFIAKPDILMSSTETTMTTPSAGNASYACGWAVNSSHNWWHTGSLPGTSTELIRGQNGFNWAILTNKRGPNSSQMSTDIDQLLWPVVNDASTPWQDIEQF